ncbi:hypothetical protein ACE102_33720 [Bradyrhizobium sp. vgs-9]|uniref:hypothetical protein n=1 Tax=Bradyrhizobium sp. vgs-9 TaxID=208389 RepID=UPI0035D5281F
MVDTVKTRTQLKERAAKNLAVIEPGEALSAEDDDTFDGLVDPLIAQLAADDIIYIQDSDAIEVELFLPLARLLANIAGPDFGSPINEDAKRSDEALLRRLAAATPTYAALKVDYF